MLAQVSKVAHLANLVTKDDSGILIVQNKIVLIVLETVLIKKWSCLVSN